MTVNISHTADIQAFFDKVAGLDHAEGNPRFKKIIRRVLQDPARLIEDLEVSEDEFWHAIDYLNRLGGRNEAGLLAAGLGIELDEVTETHTRIPAPEDFRIAAGPIPAGSTAAMRFEVRGMVDGHPAVVLEHVTRLRADLCPDWPQPAQEGGSYRVEVTGEPSYALDLCLSSRKGDHNHAGLVATAARVVNAIAAVVAAEPGITTTLDLPLITGKGLYAAP